MLAMVTAMRVITAPSIGPSWLLPPRTLHGIAKAIERLQITVPFRTVILLAAMIVIYAVFPLMPRRRGVSVTMQHVVIEAVVLVASIASEIVVVISIVTVAIVTYVMKIVDIVIPILAAVIV
jgi:hypothetical protein